MHERSDGSGETKKKNGFSQIANAALGIKTTTHGATTTTNVDDVTQNKIQSETKKCAAARAVLLIFTNLRYINDTN